MTSPEDSDLRTKVRLLRQSHKMHPPRLLQRRRHTLKILKRPPTPRVFQEWTAEEDALVGTAPDAQIAGRPSVLPAR